MSVSEEPHVIESLRPWMRFGFSRSRGPGGQNVNKVSTRVTLLFDIEACPALTSAHKRRLRQRFASYFDAEHRLRIVCQETRSQSDNKALAEERLLSMLRTTLHPAKPRIKTAPTAGSRRRRLDAKQRRSTALGRRRSRSDE